MTDTTVIQPGVGQSILTTEDHDHGRHHHGYYDGEGRFRAVEARADFRSLTNEIERFGTQNLASAARTNEIVQAGNCRTDSLVQAGFGDTSDRICAGVKDVTGALGTGFTAAALANCKTDDAIAAGFFATQKQVSDAATATVVGFKESQGLAFQVEGRALLEAAKNANAIAVQATMFANAAQLEAQKNAAAAQLEAQKNAAAAALEACKCCHEIQSQADRNFASLQAQADRNTCDLKQLITADGNTTRALINQNTIDDLRAFKASVPRGVAVTLPVGV